MRHSRRGRCLKKDGARRCLASRLPDRRRLSEALILKGGLRDGFAGFTIASFAAHHAFLKHLMLWEKQTTNNTEKTETDA